MHAPAPAGMAEGLGSRGGLRILYASDLLGPHDYRFLSALLEMGHAPVLLTYLHDIDRPNFVNQGFDVRTLPGLTVIREASLCLPPVSGRGLGRLWMSLKHRRLMTRRAAHFRQVVERVQPDLIHAGWVQTSGWYAAMSGFRPLVLMPWGSDILLDAGSDPAMRARARWVLERADAVTCDCELVKREIQAMVPIPDGRFLILPWGVDLEVFRGRPLREGARRRFGWAPDEAVLVSTRTFRKVYGVDTTIRAFAKVFRARPSARLALLGDGPEQGALRQLARELGVWERTTWMGYTDEATILAALSGGDLYVSPSHSDGSSVSLLEAMASELPCLLSDLPGNREWVAEGGTGHLVAPGDDEALARRMLQRLEDPAGSARMGAAARAVVRARADWHRNVRGLDALYEGALAGRRARQ